MSNWNVNTGKYRILADGEFDAEFDKSRQAMAEKKARFWGVVKYVSLLVSIVLGLIGIGIFPRVSDLVTKAALTDILKSSDSLNAKEHETIKSQLNRQERVLEDFARTNSASLKAIDEKLWTLVQKRKKEDQ